MEHQGDAMRGTFNWAGALAILTVAGAGCSHQSSSAQTPAGVLTVTVQQVGGPMLPNGSTPTQPVANAEVQVATAAGATVSTATSNAGVATFRLWGGTYYVSVPTCGYTGKREVKVTSPGSTSLKWVCPVP
jgi:hypothetical protein